MATKHTTEHKGFIYIETSRLIIRDHRADDLSTHHSLLSDPKAMYYLPDIKTNTIAESNANLTFSMKEIGDASRAHVFLRMEEKETGLHVGEIGYTVSTYTPVGKIADLGYFSNLQYWNRGYVTEAVQALLDFAFLQDNVMRISTGCLKENIGSERVMQKCGFIKEGELKQYAWHDGTLKDRVVYRLLRDEWLSSNQL